MVHVVPPSGHKDFFAQLFSHDAILQKNSKSSKRTILSILLNFFLTMPFFKKIQKVLSEQF
jgi:hypothetical protein